MGSLFGGGGSNANTTTNTSSPPPQTLADYNALINRGTAVANTPYTPYPGEQVAPLSNQMNAGLGNVDQYAYSAQPYLSQAGQMTQQAAGPVTPQSYSGAAVGQFMNPFTSSVVDATQQEFNNQNAQQAQFLNSQNIGAGAFGGDRAGLSQAVLAGQQQTAQAPVIAGLNQSNYNQALAEFNNQQQTGLGAQEFNNQQLGQMAAQYGNLGTSAQTAGLQGAGAQMQAGAVPQAEQQAIDQSLQNTWNQGQAYPFQTTGFLGNLIEGIGSQTGGNASTTTPAPSLGSQLLGLGTAGAGIASNLFGSSAGGTSAASGIGSAISGLFGFSDVRLKENITPIGKTFDGQTIHKYNFKGDPRTQIGLLAQEVEHRHPGAVGAGLGGLKMVDYDAATRESERAGFDAGGATSVGSPSPGSVFDLGVGKGFSPAGAMALMDPNSGAGAGTGRFGAGNLSMTPGGTLFGRGAAQVAPPAAGPSPTSPLQAGPSRQPSTAFAPSQPGPMFRPTPGQVMQARGGRIGREIGGATGLGGPIVMSGIPDTPFVDFSTPAAIAQGTGVPNPYSGTANIEFSNATGTNSGAGSQNATQIGTSSLSPSQPNLSGAPAGTTFKPIDYQDPGSDFQTAGAEASLGPHYFTTGKNGELVYGGEGSSTASGAVNNGELLPRPGGNLPTDTPKTENPPPAAPAPAAPAPAAPAPKATAAAAPQRRYLGQVSGGAAATNAGMQGGELLWGYWDGGRIGRDNGGGLGGLDDPRYSFYTPQTGNARGAAYHPPIPTPAPQPAPSRIFAPAVPPPRPAVRQAPIRIPLAAKAAAPQPLTQPTPPHTPTPAPKPMVLPTLNPADTPIPRPPLLPGSYDDPSAPGAGIYHPMDPGRRGGLMGAFDNPLDSLKDQLNQNLDDRPGFNLGGANAGMMGQWPLAGATGYTPQGHGVTGQDSQGAPMGAGSVAKKAAGFDGMFGSGFWHGGRTGFQDGGLSGLGMMPEIQPVPYDILAGVQPLSIGKGAPQPKAAEQKPSSSPGGDLGSLGKSLGSLANAFKGSGSGGLDSLSDSDFGDIASGATADFSDLPDDTFDLSRGGFIGGRRRFDDGGGDGDGNAGGTSDGVSGSVGFGGAPSGQGGIGSDAVAANTASQGGQGTSGVSGRGGSPASPGPGAGSTGGTTGHGGSSGAGGGGGGGGGGTGPGGTGGGGGTASGGSGTSGGGAGGASGVHGGSAPGYNTNPLAAMLAMYESQNPFDISGNAALAAGLGLGGPGGLSGALSGVGIASPVSPVTVSQLGPPAKGGQGGAGTDGGSAASNPSVAAQVNAAVEAMYESQHPYGNAGFGGGSPSATQGTTGPAAPAPASPPPGTPAVVANPGGGSPGGGSPGGTAPRGIGGTPGGPAGPASPAAVTAPSPGLGAVQGGGGSGRDPTQYAADTAARHAFGGRTRFDLGGVVRPGFLDGGPPDPPTPVPPAPIVPPAPTPAAAPAAAAISAATTPKFDASAFPTNRAEATPAQRDAFNRAYAKSIGLDPDKASGVARAEGLNAAGAGPSTVDVENGHPFSFGDYQLNTKAGVGVDALKAGIDPRDPNQWQKANMFALDTMKKGGLGPWKTDAYVKGLGGSGGGGGGGGALAYDGAGGGGGGQNQQEQQYNAAIADAERAPDKKLLPPSIGDTLIMAGAGMMAGTSPHPLVNIGQGIQEGMKYYQNQRQLDREWQKNEAQIQDWQSQSKYRDAQTGLATQNMSIELYKLKLGQWNMQYQGWLAAGGHGDPPPYPTYGGANVGSPAAAPTASKAAPVASPAPAAAPATPTTAAKPIPITPGAVVGAPGGPKTAAGAPPAVAAPATPPTTAKGPGGAPAAPATPAAAPPAADAAVAAGAPSGAPGPDDPFWKNVPPEENPYELNRRSQLYRAAAGVNPENAKTADELAARAHSIWDSGLAGGVQIPGVADQKATTKYKDEIAGTTGKEDAAIPEQMQKRQQLDAQLGEMQKLMVTFQPEHYAEQKAQIAGAVASIFGADAVPQGALDDAASTQRFLKDQMNAVMTQTQAMGGRILQSEIETFKKAVASPNMQPAAAAGILAQMRGLIKWQDAHDDAYQDWREQNPAAPKTRFERTWLRDPNNSPDKFITDARHGFAYKGQVLPPAAKREVGQTYMVDTPRGPEPHVWGKDGGAFGWEQ